MITLDDLNPAARAALIDYLDAATGGLAPDLADAVACDLRSWALDHLDADSTPEDVAALAEQAGPVDAGGQDEAGSSGAGSGNAEAGRPGDGSTGDGRLSGRVLGVPYNLRLPTAAELTEALWNPEDPRLFRPRTFGAGWDLNFGALAVRLGAIEPDAEAVPFAATPERAFRLAAALPQALAAAVVAHYVFRYATLPATLPSHWGLDGSADRRVAKARVATQDLAAAVSAAAVATAASASRRPGQARAGLLAGAAAVASASAGLTVWRSLPDRRRPLAGIALVKGTVLAAGATLLYLARAGRAAEIAHDLGDCDDR